MLALEVRDISVERTSGSRRRLVLDQVSLSLFSREIVALQAPSGSGKTTLLGAIAGLLTTVKGSVRLAGHRLDNLTRVERAECRSKRIGFIFQRPNLLPELSCSDNVRLSGVLAGMSKKKIEESLSLLLDDLDVTHLAERFPKEVSGGEEQRFGIARALLHSPELVLADEPTGNLDRESSQRVADLLVSCAKNREAAVLIATHDPQVAIVADRVLTIFNGKLEANKKAVWTA